MNKKAPCPNYSFVPNSDDCKWLWGTTGAERQKEHMDVTALNLLQHHTSITAWLMFTLRSSRDGSLSAADLKRQNATPYYEMKCCCCSSLLQTKRSLQTVNDVMPGLGNSKLTGIPFSLKWIMVCSWPHSLVYNPLDCLKVKYPLHLKCIISVCGLRQ